MKPMIALKSLVHSAMRTVLSSFRCTEKNPVLPFLPSPRAFIFSKSFFEFPKRQSFVGLKGGKAISMVFSLFGVSTIVDILDDFLFPRDVFNSSSSFF